MVDGDGAMTAAPQFPAVVVHDDRGDLHGLLIGRDPERGQSLVAVTRKDAPGWFQQAHTSPAPHIWVKTENVIFDAKSE